MSLCSPAPAIALRGGLFTSNYQCCSSALPVHGHQRCSGMILSHEEEDLVRARLVTVWPPRGRYPLSGGVARDCNRLQRESRRRAGSKVQCMVGEGSNLSVEDWTKKLPAKRKALYSHSLPCIEAWLHTLGFVQGKEERSVWTIERPDWHAQLSLDLTELYIRYLKKGPGNLERDIERKFSYALSREDLENAILGGP